MSLGITNFLVLSGITVFITWIIGSILAYSFSASSDEYRGLLWFSRAYLVTLLVMALELLIVGVIAFTRGDFYFYLLGFNALLLGFLLARFAILYLRTSKTEVLNALQPK